jgi:opacity protein-like surface antigen
MNRLASLVFVTLSSPAWAQQIELAPLVSYTTEAGIHHDAAGVQDLSVSRGITWGAQATYFLTDHVGLEALWTYQSTDVSIESGGGTGELFTMTMNQLHGNLVYQFRGPDAPVMPFVFGGFGATRFDAPDLDHDTKMSWTVGGGVKWFPQRHVGMRAQARYKPTQLNDGANDFCNPFGFCQTSLTHFEIAAGAVFRF